VNLAWGWDPLALHRQVHQRPNNLNRSGQQNEQILTRRLACDPPRPAEPPAEPINDMPDAEFYEQILQVHAKLAANGIHLPAPFPRPNRR
jgi:hypothetical protein